MWPFKRKTKTILPPNWQETLQACDFVEARAVLAKTFEIGQIEAEEKGGYYVYQVEMVAAWNRLAENPCLETAIVLLEAAPQLWPIFATCQRGRMTGQRVPDQYAPAPEGNLVGHGSVWFSKAKSREYGRKASDLAPLLVEICTGMTPILIKALYGDEPSREDQDSSGALSLELLVFLLHLTDRMMFSRLGHAARAVFMDALLRAVKSQLQAPFDGRLAGMYNERQQFYGGFPRLYAEEGKPLAGTLFWQFGKAIGSVYARANPVAVTLATMAAMDLMKPLDEALRLASVIR